MCGRAGRQQQLEIGGRRRAQAGAAGLRRFVDDEHRLSRPVLARDGQGVLTGPPELGDRALLPDQHLGAGAGGHLGEGAAAAA